MNTDYLNNGKRDEAKKYVAEHLDGCEYSVCDFVVSALDPKTRLGVPLVACPGCAFLHMAGTGCDICSVLPTVSGMPVILLRHPDDGETFRRTLAQARQRRARTLYELWMSGHLGADALFLASLPAEELASDPFEIPEWTPVWGTRTDERCGELVGV